MQPPHAEPSQGAAESAARPPLLERAAGLFTQHFGHPRGIVQWGAERVPARLLIVRWVLLAAGVLALVVVWAPPRARGNLARRASVTMSSDCGAQPHRSPLPIEAARLVDGRADRDYDACTAAERGAWVQLDLGARASLDKVVVRGRADCCWAVDALPLVLEIAEAGGEFREVARRKRPFTRDEPWRATLGAQTARLVRVRSASNEKADIVLSEIEIYGQPTAGEAARGAAGSP